MSFRHPVSIFFLREGPNSPSHLGGNQHLATHVAALLSARLLVLHPASGSWAKCHWDVLKAKGGLGTIMIPASSLNVDASGAVLNEHLGELHSGGDASMASVCICDDGIQVVLIAIRVGSKKNCTEFIYSKPSVSHTNVSLARARSTTENAIARQLFQLGHPSINHWSLGALVWIHATSLLVLLAIVEELGSEELIHLIRRLAGILMPQEAMNHDYVSPIMTCPCEASYGAFSLSRSFPRSAV